MTSKAQIHTEEWLDERIRSVEEQLGACIAQRDHYLARIQELNIWLEGYKEAREIFLTYRVNSEVRERMIRTKTYIVEPPLD